MHATIKANHTTNNTNKHGSDPHNNSNGNGPMIQNSNRKINTKTNRDNATIEREAAHNTNNTSTKQMGS